MGTVDAVWKIPSFLLGLGAKVKSRRTLECPNLWKKGSKRGKFVTYLSHGQSRKN
jgi:hypothetical protein